MEHLIQLHVLELGMSSFLVIIIQSPHGYLLGEVLNARMGQRPEVLCVGR